VTEQQAWPVTVERTSNGDYMVFPEHMLNGFPATADELSAAGITPPAPDTPTPKEVIARYIAMPVPPDPWELAHAEDILAALTAAGYEVVHVPAAPDKLTALHTLGLTDEDIAYAAEKWVDGAWLIDGTNKRLTVAIGDRQRIADALTEVADYHVTECVDMHGDQGEDGPGDGCCFHARAAYRVGDAARLLRGAASLSPTPTPKFVCPVCGEWRDREGTCDACIPLVHDMLADAAPTPTPDHCPTCDSDDPRRRHAVESWISDSIRCDEPCVSPWHRYDSGQP